MIHLSQTAVLGLYVLSTLPGISTISESGGAWISELLYQAGKLPTAVHSWVGLPSVPKVQSMAEYVLFTSLVGATILLSYFLGRFPFWPSQATKRLSLGFVAYCAAAALIPYASQLSPLIFPSGLSMGAWLIVVAAFPALVGVSDRLQRVVQIPAGGKVLRLSVLPALSCLLLVGLVIFLYQTAWNSKLIFSNDFSALPEYTRLSSGEWVEHNAFMRENRFPGRVHDDPCTKEYGYVVCIRLARDALASPRAAFAVFPIGSGLYYDWDREWLVIYRPLTKQECLNIQAWVQNPGDYCDLGPAVKEPQKLNFLLDQREEEFYRINRSIIGMQTHLGQFFFHHAYFYLPILQATSSKEIGADMHASPLPTQYGHGLTQVFSSLLKITGDSSFESYFKMYWMGPGLYLLLCVLAAYCITGRLELAVAMGALVVLLLPFQSVEAMRLAPGFNPWRHLPDVLCFLAVAWYASRPSWYFGVLRAISIAFLFWWNREFGLFMLAGSLAWHFLCVAQGPDRRPRIIGQAVLEILVVVLAHLLFSPVVASANELMAYNLLGVGAPPTRWLDVFLYPTLWGGLLILTVWMRWRARADLSSRVLEVAGVGFAYAAFCSTYALWNPSPNHSLVVWLCASVPLICVVSAGLARLEIYYSRIARQISIYFSTALTVGAVLAGASAGVNHHQFFKRLFENHRAFEWVFPGLNGRTTADPAPIVASLELINRELPSGPLTLLSRHDVLLHIVSGRLSALPYIDIPSALVGFPMIDSLRTRIETIRPKVIFMDTDIFESREPELHGLGDPAVMRHRAGHLAALGLLARELGECYEPGPASGLLRAWHRTCK